MDLIGKVLGQTRAKLKKAWVWENKIEKENATTNILTELLL